MKQKLHLIIMAVLLGFGFQAKAQLVAGDIVVLGLAADTGTSPLNGIDEFTWMPLVNIPQGTKIYFTDAGWYNNGNSFGASGDGIEFLVRYDAPSLILAGTIMTVTQASTPSGYTFVTGTQCGNAGFVNIPNAGDSITVFQSNATENSSFPGTNFTAIFSVTNSTTNWAALTSDRAAQGSNSDNVTNLPPGLSVSGAHIAVGNGAGETDEADNVRYVGTTTTGSKAVILAAVTNYSNWARHDGAGNNPDLNAGAASGWTANGVSSYVISGSDNIPPVVNSISISGSPVANTASMAFVVTFDESVKNVDTGDFNLQTVSGDATGTIFSVSSSTGTSITVTVNNISGSGSFRLRLNSNTNIQDVQNNGGGTNGFVAAYNSGAVHNVDRVAPSLTITSSSTNPTNLNPIPITFTFSESVTGFDSTDVVVTGGSISSVSGSGADYTANITPSADGTITVNVAASRAVDLANNSNTAATQFTRTSDRTQPTVSLTSPVSNPTNANSFTLTITFSESVSNFLQSDILVSNASLSAFSGGTGSVYTVTVTPTANGAVTANVNAGVANDAANNQNAAATQFSTVSDKAQPTVSITSPGTPNPTNSNSINLTITFSESVSNFIQGDLVISGASITSFAGSGANYIASISPSGSGTITANIAAGVANDSANNGNTAATQFSIVSDTTQPSVSITAASTPNPTNSSSIPVTVTFSESVANFIQGDVTLSNCNINSFSGSGTTYTFTIVPSSNGAVTVNISAGVANDAAGNTNTAAPQFSRIFDNIAPAFQTPGPPPGITNTSPYLENITLTESSTDFTAADIQISNGTLTGFSGSGTSYTATVTPTANGTVTLSVAAGTFHDAAGNANTATLTRTTLYDNTQPTVSISSVTSDPTNVSSIPVTVTFSESVSNFTSGDVTVGNGNLNSFSGSGTTYTFNVVPVSNGTVTVDVAAGVANDQASNLNTAATQFSRTVDNVQPTVSISSPVSNPTNASSIPVTVTFSESVVNFVAGDVTIANGTLNSFSGSGTTYTFNIVPVSNGTVTVDVFGAVANDAANNGNAAATQLSRVYDNVQPTVSITSPATSPSNAASFTVNFTFSEAVTDFVSGDISASNASLSNFSGSGANYSVTVTPTADGTVTVDIAAAVAHDAAGNSNTAATQFSILSDKNAPSLTITSTAANPTNLATIPLTFTFSESVTGFDVTDVTAFGGSLSGFSGSGTTYTASLTPSADGSITLFVFQNSAFDAGGNGNTFATFSIVSDRTKPTVSITSTESTPTSANPIPITFTFSENTTNFAIGDITVTGGTLTNFSGSGNTYTVGLIPSGNGSKTIRLLANVMSDAAGNTNNASATFSIFYITPCSQPTVWNGLFWSGGNPVPTQPAIINADYVSSDANPGGFSACSLIIATGANAIISPADNLTITGNVTVQTGGTLTFQSSSSLTLGGNLTSANNVTFKSGSNFIQTAASNNNSGNIIYERETTFRRLDYTFWSSPVAGQNLKAFSPQTVSPPVGASRFYVVDESTNAFAAVDPLVTDFAPATGYMLRSPNDFGTTPELWTGTFTGVPNNGNYSIAAPVTNIGSNLIGNPYPSTINADLFLATNPGTLYFYAHSNTSPAVSGGYATYTSLGPTAGVSGELPNGYIQAGQGFIYQPASSTTAQFTNSMREINNDNQFFRSPVAKHRLWLNLKDQAGFLNQILIGYMDGATDGNDTSLDGKSRATGTAISSTINTEKYAVQARPLPFNDSDTVPLSFTAETDGTYSLSLDHFDGLFSEDQDIFLKDNLTGTFHDLKQSAYSFATIAGEFPGRFTIVYQSTLGVENPAADQNSIIVYNENGDLKINSGALEMSNVKVFDIRGRLLLESNGINASAVTLTGLHAATQLLVVQVTANDITVTRKVVY